MATHSGVLAWRIPWTEEPGRLQSVGHKESLVFVNRNFTIILCYFCCVMECFHITSWKYLIQQKNARTSCFMFSSHNILKNF